MLMQNATDPTKVDVRIKDYTAGAVLSMFHVMLTDDIELDPSWFKPARGTDEEPLEYPDDGDGNVNG
jgi:hypothetical protein